MCIYFFQPSVRLTPATILYAGKSPDCSHILVSNVSCQKYILTYIIKFLNYMHFFFHCFYEFFLKQVITFSIVLIFLLHKKKKIAFKMDFFFFSVGR